MNYTPPRYPLHYFLPPVICGLSMGTGVSIAVSEGLNGKALALVALSLVMWMWGRSLQRKYFEARYAELEAVFERLNREYGKRR